MCQGVDEMKDKHIFRLLDITLSIRHDRDIIYFFVFCKQQQMLSTTSATFFFLALMVESIFFDQIIIKIQYNQNDKCVRVSYSFLWVYWSIK
jgi:uncharacterized membrane protein YciS (DUF1049 family)